MAPEFAPSMVIFDARFERDSLVGSIEYVESLDPDRRRLRVRWAVESQPKDYLPVGGGVAYVNNKESAISVLPISEDAKPTPLDNSRYLWKEGLPPGCPWLMFILILPKNHALVDPDPLPADTKAFAGRLALYWVLKGDEMGRTRVELTMKEIQTDLHSELIKINKRYLSKQVPIASTITVEDGATKGDKKEAYTPSTWEKVVAVAVAVFVFGLVAFLVVRNTAFADLNLVLLIRTVLSISAAILGATIPGFLHLDWKGKGFVIRAGGALALFVLTYAWSPSVISATPTSGPKNSEISPPPSNVR
jgi:hypothetical protein